ncbi:hypothetical protein [Sphingomonas sp. YL-JM2C]
MKADDTATIVKVIENDPRLAPLFSAADATASRAICALATSGISAGSRSPIACFPGGSAEMMAKPDRAPARSFPDCAPIRNRLLRIGVARVGGRMAHAMFKASS